MSHIALSYLLILCFSLTAFPQGSRSCVTINLKNGHKIMAEFVKSDDDAIYIIDNAGKPQTVKMSDVGAFKLTPTVNGTCVAGEPLAPVKQTSVPTTARSSIGGNIFKVRYNGGTIETKIKQNDWNNTLTVTSDYIVLKLRDGTTVSIDPQRVTGLSYGRHASRRIGTYAVAAALINPLFLLGMLKKNKQHFVGIEYETADGKKGGFLLQAKNDKYRSLLTALKGVTGKDVETEEKK